MNDEITEEALIAAGWEKGPYGSNLYGKICKNGIEIVVDYEGVILEDVVTLELNWPLGGPLGVPFCTTMQDLKNLERMFGGAK